MDKVPNPNNLDADAADASLYSQRDLIVDGIIALAALAVLVFIMAAAMGTI